jgi:hypothetical protein
MDFAPGNHRRSPNRLGEVSQPALAAFWPDGNAHGRPLMRISEQRFRSSTATGLVEDVSADLYGSDG